MKIIPSALALAAITTFTLSAGSAWATQPVGMSHTGPPPAAVASPSPAAVASPSPATSMPPAAMPMPSPSNSSTGKPVHGRPVVSQPVPPSSVQPSVGCALFPASPFCLLPLIRSLPACPQSMWVNNGSGWKCVPLTPPSTPKCDPPFSMPMLVNVTWVCVGGPGPELPGRPHTMPMEPASPVSNPVISSLVSAVRG